ncbi:IS66 family transposase [Faecalibacterium gallinarum]|uniref:Transposase n=5 Tax=Faecalibacterium TaxID=216851 RepID=A0AA37IYF9_9FIRM|nr:IS66 family transposase [Faecalibacterium gallinarum]GJN64612.1 transposase [Faecalibacterium gallinarum]
MNLDTQNLPPEVAAYIRSLEQEKQRLEQEKQLLEKQLVKMQSLNEQLVQMRKRMFGQSSEQIQYVDAQQLDFFNEAEACSDASAPEPGKTTPVKAHARKAKRTKEELTEGLEHKKVVCELPEQEQICAKCGSTMVRIGEKFVRSELVIVPAQVYVVDYYAASYKCAHCEAQTGESYIRQAEAPVPVMKKSMAAPSTVAYIMQEKFQNGVPLYRQEAYWKGQGVDLRRNTMANWVIRSARWFKPLYEQLRRELLRQDIVNVDETRVHVLKEDGRESSQMSQMWVFCSAEKKIALYQYSPSRSGRVAKEMLQGFSGYTQTDGYSGYNCLDSVTHVGCWAHARRKWVECFVDGKPVQGSRSEAAFHLIEEMFSLEQAWKDQSPEARFTQRQEKLRPLLNSYWELLDSFEAAEGTALSKAKAYSLNQKQALSAVLLDGRLELTNNLAERTVKPFVMARKNFLFCDTAKGADASALCFSVIETAKHNGLDPFGYLLFLLQELPKLGENPTEEQLVPLLPWAESLPEYCKLK